MTHSKIVDGRSITQLINAYAFHKERVANNLTHVKVWDFTDQPATQTSVRDQYRIISIKSVFRYLEQ